MIWRLTLNRGHGRMLETAFNEAEIRDVFDHIADWEPRGKADRQRADCAGVLALGVDETFVDVDGFQWRRTE